MSMRESQYEKHNISEDKNLKVKYENLMKEFKNQIDKILEDNKKELEKNSIEVSYFRGDTSHRGYLTIDFSIDWEKVLKEK